MDVDVDDASDALERLLSGEREREREKDKTDKRTITSSSMRSIKSG
jgi:hypothetical protein